VSTTTEQRILVDTLQFDHEKEWLLWEKNGKGLTFDEWTMSRAQAEADLVLHLIEINRTTFRSINKHSERLYISHNGRLYKLSRTLDGCPPFFEAYGPYAPDYEGVLPRLKVDDHEYWGDGWSWKRAEKAFLEAVNAAEAHIARGDTVRLKSRIKTSSGRRETARVVTNLGPDIPGGLTLDNNLEGIKYWNEDDVELVIKLERFKGSSI
jgi:hypothetical protein